MWQLLARAVVQASISTVCCELLSLCLFGCGGLMRKWWGHKWYCGHNKTWLFQISCFGDNMSTFFMINEAATVLGMTSEVLCYCHKFLTITPATAVVWCTSVAFVCSSECLLWLWLVQGAHCWRASMGWMWGASRLAWVGSLWAVKFKLFKIY